MRKYKIILAIFYFFIFVFLNYSIYYLIFKSPWTTPDIFFRLKLNLAFSFLVGLMYIFPNFIGCMIFYTYPAILLSYNTIDKFYNTDSEKKDSFTIWTIRPKFIFFTILIASIFIIGYFSYGVALLSFPAMIIVFIEYYLLFFLSKILLRFTSNLNFFIIKIFIILLILIALFTILFYISPIRSCVNNSDYCISVSAAKNNNPRICEKVGSNAYLIGDCYGFLAVANNNKCFCEFLSKEGMEKKHCYGRYEDYAVYKKSLDLHYKKELTEAKFKDLSILDSLNCNNN